MSTDLQQLARLIQLSGAPSAATFEILDKGSPGLGPSDWALVALLTVDEKTAEGLSKSATVAGPVLAPLLRPWLPSAVSEALRNDPVLREAVAFTRSPLSNGYAVVLPGNQVFLYLYTS